MRFIILFLLLVPTASPAQNFAVSLDVDLNGDGLPDQARLTETPKGGVADLAILLGQPDGSLKQDVIAKSLVWVGGEGEKNHSCLLIKTALWRCFRSTGGTLEILGRKV
jgi:hypothetical protein